MADLIYFIILVGLGYFIGTQVEKKHYASLKRREALYLQLPAATAKNVLEDRPIEKALLVSASAAISTDYFKTLLSGLRNLLGGEISAHETILDRSRREAIVRLKEKAIGADIILNLRIETSAVSMMGGAEVLAYGTAIYYRK